MEEPGTFKVTQRLVDSTRHRLLASDVVMAPSMTPRSTRPAATAKKLVDIMTLDGEQPTTDKAEEILYFRPISYFPNGKQMIEGSPDKWIRRWDLQTGEEIAEARIVCEREVWAVAVSSDSRWVITGGGDQDRGDLGWHTEDEKI